jgi:hypothetical protein
LQAGFLVGGEEEDCGGRKEGGDFFFAFRLAMDDKEGEEAKLKQRKTEGKT